MSLDDDQLARAETAASGASLPEPEQPARNGGSLDAGPQPAPGTPLDDGLALTVDEANTFAAAAGARLIMPLGPPSVGKTTLSVELYGRFLQHIEWAGCSFAGSRTLLDYERLAFPSRLNAGVSFPTTWRTRLGEDRYLLHMAVVSTDGRRSDILLANQSGELSDHVRDGADPHSELPLLSHAERILICVDGEEVATPALIGRAVSNTRQLVETLRERGTFMPAAQAALVLTKYDKVVAVHADARWETAEQELLRRLAAIGRPARAFRVAARPASAAPNERLEDLMRWLVAVDEPSRLASPEPSSSSRAMGRFPST